MVSERAEFQRCKEVLESELHSRDKELQSANEIIAKYAGMLQVKSKEVHSYSGRSQGRQ